MASCVPLFLGGKKEAHGREHEVGESCLLPEPRVGDLQRKFPGTRLGLQRHSASDALSVIVHSALRLWMDQSIFWLKDFSRVTIPKIAWSSSILAHNGNIGLSSPASKGPRFDFPSPALIHRFVFGFCICFYVTLRCQSSFSSVVFSPLVFFFSS